jgi:Coenzyme PQQ synthesis protein D (PqqD)
MIRPASDVIARNLGDAAVLISLNNSRIYELNATGARAWEFISEGITRDQLVEKLQQEFDGDDIPEAVNALIDSLRAEGLI